MTMRAAVLAFALCVLWAGASAQNAASADCPATARDLPVEALYGRWQARIDGQPGVATVQLAKHPEYAGVRGTIARPAAGNAAASVAQLAGDIDDEGTLSIDESLDGRSISGVWSGTLQPGACGRAFKGTWRSAGDETAHPFTLNKEEGPLK